MTNWPKNLDGGMSPDEDLLLEPLPLEDQFAKDVRTLRKGAEPLIPESGVARMSKEQLKQFILDVLDGKVFTSEQIDRTTFYECSECGASCGQHLDERGATHCCSAVPQPQVRWGVEPQLVFLPLAFLDEESLSRLMKHEQEIGCFWGPMKSALPRGINGYPMLMEMGIMHIEDWAKAHKVLIREYQRRQELDLDDV